MKLIGWIAIKNVGNDAVADFLPVSLWSVSPFVLVVSSSTGIKSLDEYINYIKANPNKLRFGTNGPGTINFAALWMHRLTGRS